MEFICGSEIFLFVCFIVVLVWSSHGASALWEFLFKLSEHSVHPLLIVNVVDESFAENAAHNLQMRRVEV